MGLTAHTQEKIEILIMFHFTLFQLCMFVLLILIFRIIVDHKNKRVKREISYPHKSTVHTAVYFFLS